MRPATAGDAILRLMMTAIVDAVEELWRPEWGAMSWHLKGFTRDGPRCEAKVARKAVENQLLALLYEKMRMCEVVPEGVTSPESVKIKASLMECLFAELYEVEGDYAGLAELLLVCMVQALIFLAIYDVETNRSLLPHLGR